MSKDFLMCVKEKGKVITKELPKGKYMKLCKDKAGKWHSGEIMTKKTSKVEEIVNGGKI